MDSAPGGGGCYTLQAVNPLALACFKLIADKAIVPPYLRLMRLQSAFHQTV